MLQNPIIPGFYPDPSIVRVKDDFYVVNSSFEYFPAIPIWHSKDLTHWRQIGNAVNRPAQGLDLSEVKASGGVQAATIRHHNETFYITSTRVGQVWPKSDQHFIVSATNIEGPWSECHFIQDAPGIDSSLFFDDEGKSYFLANRERTGAKDGNDAEIWIAEIDLDTYALVGDKKTLWAGTGGIYPEGPRLFKRNGWYYLLVAEGGTLHNHATTFARSRNVWGPYESSPRNPVLTHRHLSREYPIQNVGHADMVELKDGSWWGVCLGSRPAGGFYDGGNVKYSFGGYYRNLGRETFAFPVTWPADDLGPLFTPDSGRVLAEYDAPNLLPYPQVDVGYLFDEISLRTKWVTIRDTNLNRFSLDAAAAALSIRLGETIEDSFIGVRQTSWKFNCQVTLDLHGLKTGDAAGLGSYIKSGFHHSVQVSPASDGVAVTFVSPKGVVDSETVLTDLRQIEITVSGRDQDYVIALPQLGISRQFDGREISCDMTDSHTGVMIALYGTSEQDSTAKFTNFEYSIEDPKV
jgi:alpha-N-arabinofuranosidase